MKMTLDFTVNGQATACDGIGGTVKRLLTKASLQRPYTDPILTNETIMDFCIKCIPGIHFFNIIPQDIASTSWEGFKRIKRSKEHSNFTSV